jgi:hypothetical protein
MKLFKVLIILSIPILFLSFLFFASHNKKNQLNPISSKNDFYSNFEYAFFMAKLKPVAINLQNWNDKVEFYLDNTKVIFSTQKNPYWQITSLQQTLNIGKIRNKEIKFIDLSIDHPYATFKNN